jgi:flavin reductase (DIM6/NTAB) family NADH-FMN oxidoreductase RutF
MTDEEGRMSQSERTPPLYAALGRVPSGLFIITVGSGDAASGMLASWVQQCSFQPPQLSVAVKRGRGLNEQLTPGTAFTVNILADDQTHLIAHFGRGFSPGEPAFAGIEVEQAEGVPPVLAEALAYLHCRVSGRCEAGDHDLVLGEVVGGKLQADGEPMVHIRKSGAHY